MKMTISILLLTSLLLVSSSFALPTTVSGGGGGAEAPAPESKDETAVERWCGDKCEVRCKEAGKKDRCLEYCGICCKECKCVPSGTYGNKHECACYRDKLSRQGTPKCP